MNQGLAVAVWRFGEFELDCRLRQLRHAGIAVHLSRRPFDVLEFLVQARGRLVTRDELLQEFWAGGEVYDEALTRCISSVRKALGDVSDPPRFLETRWAEGYRFIGELAVASPDVPAEPLVPASMPATSSTPAPSTATLPATGLLPGRRWAWLGAAVLCLVLGGVAYLLRQSAGTVAVPVEPVRRLAMLPLRADGVGSAAEEGLAEGLTDDLIQSLSRIEGLTIVAPGPAAGQRATGDLRQLARALGVQALLTGTLRREGTQNVLALRLVSGADAAVLWTYDQRQLPDDLRQSRAAVAQALAMKLSARLRAGRVDVAADGEAYALYLRGRYYWNQRTAAAVREAIRLFEASIAREPAFAPAHAGLAESWSLMPLYGGLAPYDAYPKARDAAQAALRLNPELARAEAVLGVVSSQFDWRWDEADAHFARAIAMDPNHATTYQWRAEMYCYRSRFAECELNMREARALDPLAPIVTVTQGMPDRFAGRYAEARRHFAAALAKYPNFAFAEFQVGLIDSAEGKWADAITHLERVLPAMGPVLGGAPLGYAYARAGRADDALRMRAALESLSATGYVPPVAFGDIAMGFGDRELALAWLERAETVRDEFLPAINVDHHYRELRGEPRFEALLKRVGVAVARR